ncbi:hypothetical protein [Escherichia coli]|uniref:hypothetical protein n=1 Tax=Escherichia coli TaxID=562 RepID=UPI00203A9EDF|nr:hypothetical protein [Escherichia coli]
MAMGSVVHLLFFLSEQCYLMPFSTYRIGTGLPCQSGRWSGGNKVNYSACKWYQSSVAMNHFIGGKSGGSIYYKPIQCPTGFIMTGTRMYGIGDGVDEEHVDAYCCPFG